MYFGCRPWKIQAASDMKDSSRRISFYSTRKQHARFQSRGIIASPILQRHLWTTTKHVWHHNPKGEIAVHIRWQQLPSLMVWETGALVWCFSTDDKINLRCQEMLPWIHLIVPWQKRVRCGASVHPLPWTNNLVTYLFGEMGGWWIWPKHIV